MPAIPWANPDQKVFLLSRAVAFAQAQNEKKLAQFWVDVCRDFFIQWPTPESERLPNGLDHEWDGSRITAKKKKGNNLGEELPPLETDLNKWIGLRKESIRNWYNNNGINKGKRRVGKTQGIIVALQPSPTRLLSERNMYSKKYYDTRVKPFVDEEIGDRNPDRTERLAIVNKHLGTIYANESKETKDEILRDIENERKARDTEKELGMSVVKVEKDLGPEEYLKAQAGLPDMIGDFFDAMVKRTGWSFMVVAGGPDPADNGKIRTISVHKGKDGYGNVFSKAHPAFKETFLVPYSKFLQSAYPESVRNSFKIGSDIGEDKSSLKDPFIDAPNMLKPTGSVELPIGPVVVAPSAPPTIITPDAELNTQTTLPPTSLDAIVPVSSIPTLPLAAEAGGAVGGVTSVAESSFDMPNISTEDTATEAIETAILPLISNMNVLANTFEPMTNLLNKTGSENIDGSNSWGAPFQINSDISQSDANASQMDYDFDWDLLARMLADTDNEQGFVGPSERYLPIPGNCDSSQPGIVGSGNCVGIQDVPAPQATAATNIPPNTADNGHTRCGPALPDIRSEQPDVYGMGEPRAVGPDACAPIPDMTTTIQPNITNNDRAGDDSASSEARPEQPVFNKMDANREVEPTVVVQKRSRKPTAARGEVVPLTEKVMRSTSPEWFTAAYEYLNTLDTDEWRGCLESWKSLEGEIGLCEISSHRLNRAQLRPPAITKWIVTRRYHAIPDLPDVKQFANEWLAWWNDNQPKWRQTDEIGSLPLPISTGNANDNLTCLRKGGPSGIVTILIALKWWAPIRNEDKRWAEAVNDVRSCLDNMMAGNKRKGDELGDRNGKKKRKSV